MATADELRQQLMTMIQAGQITPGYSTVNDPWRTDPWSFQAPAIFRPGDIIQDGETPQYAQGYQFRDWTPGYGTTIDPQTGTVTVGGQSYTPDEFQKRFVSAMNVSGSSGFGPTVGNQYLVDTANNSIVGQDQYQSSGFNFLKDVVLPAAAIWGGGALLGSAAGAGSGVASGAASGAAGGTGAAGSAGTLGATYIPTAVAPVTAAPITGGMAASAAALPEFTTLGSTLGGLGAAGGAGGAGGSATSSAVKGALYGDAGYGAGMTGAQTGAYDAVLGATGSKGLASAATNLPGLSTVTNLLGGGGNLASIVGGLLGASDAGKGTTATSQNQIDPRMAQYLYGTGYGDQNSLLGAAQQQFQQNRSGLNALQQQALDMQKNFLMSPEYTQGFNQLRSAGSGLLGQQVAANPFTTGQAGLLTQMPQQPTSQMAGFNPGSIQQLIAAGRGLLG